MYLVKCPLTKGNFFNFISNTYTSVSKAVFLKNVRNFNTKYCSRMPIGHKNVKSALPPRWLKVAILSFSDIFLIDKGPLADSSQKWPIWHLMGNNYSKSKE